LAFFFSPYFPFSLETRLLPDFFMGVPELIVFAIKLTIIYRFPPVNLPNVVFSVLLSRLEQSFFDRETAAFFASGGCPSRFFSFFMQSLLLLFFLLGLNPFPVYQI